LTPTPPRVNPKGEKGTGKKGKGSRTGLSPAREKKTEPGLLLAGLGKGGTAARPLDGGVLTRWGARAPTRGPATAPCLAPPSARSPTRSRRWLGCARLRRESEEERGESGEMTLGFGCALAAVGF